MKLSSEKFCFNISTTFSLTEKHRNAKLNYKSVLHVFVNHFRGVLSLVLIECEVIVILVSN